MQGAMGNQVGPERDVRRRNPPFLYHSGIDRSRFRRTVLRGLLDPIDSQQYEVALLLRRNPEANLRLTAQQADIMVGRNITTGLARLGRVCDGSADGAAQAMNSPAASAFLTRMQAADDFTTQHAAELLQGLERQPAGSCVGGDNPRVFAHDQDGRAQLIDEFR